MKKIISFLLILMVFSGFSLNGRKKTVTVVVPSGVPAVSMAKMVDEEPSPGFNMNVTYQIAKSPDLMASKIISNEADIAVIPSNLAAILYQKGIDIKLAASVVWGILYIVSDEKIDSWRGLEGKEIYTMGRGLSPDIILRYLLSENGLEPGKDVTIKYVGGAIELAPTFLTGKSSLSIMPEPMLTRVMMKRADAHVVFDLQEEWKKASHLGASYPQASLVIKGDLITKNPGFVRAFLREVKKSIDWTNRNPDKAGIAAENIMPEMKKALIEKAVPGMNIEYVAAREAKEHLVKYFNVLYQYSPKSVGGKLPDDAFYYE